MSRPLRGARLLALLGLVMLSAWLVPQRAAAQDLNGVALGPDDAPLAATPVVLHTVGGGGGAFVATDTTDAEGRFRFELEPAATGVYFAALRYEDGLYIGPAVEAGAEPVTDYVLRVEPGSEAGVVASALNRPGPMPAQARPAAQTTGGGTGSDLGAILLVTLLALAGAATFVAAAPRYRRRRTREALIQLATAENALAETTPAGSAPADRARLEDTRDRLRKQLAARS